MKIKFHSTIYNLLNTPNVMSTHFQATFEKGENTFDSIVTDTLNTDEITVYNDEDEVQGIYKGYTKRIALYVLEGNNEVSVEFANQDIESLINSLSATVTTQDAAINDLGTAVDELADSQATQDLAIEDLAEAVSGLEGE